LAAEAGCMTDGKGFQEHWLNIPSPDSGHSSRKKCGSINDWLAAVRWAEHFLPGAPPCTEPLKLQRAVPAQSSCWARGLAQCPIWFECDEPVAALILDQE
jgi:hypothetical protein